MREYIRYAISLFRLQKSSVTLVAFKTFALLQHGFDASGRFTAYLVQNNSLIKKSQGKKYSAVFCRRERGKYQIMSAFTSAVADCRRELKRLKLKY